MLSIWIILTAYLIVANGLILANYLNEGTRPVHLKHHVFLVILCLFWLPVMIFLFFAEHKLNNE